MRRFTRYNPRQIAKHVKILFKGKIHISEVGSFEFDRGRVLVPVEKDTQRLSVMSEINRQVSQLHQEFN